VLTCRAIHDNINHRTTRYARNDMTTQYAFSQTTIDAIKNVIAPVIISRFAIHNINVVCDIEYKSSDVTRVYYARVTFLNALTFVDMQRITQTMHEFCANDCDDDTYMIDGHEYMIGDGDDVSACSMKGGCLYIWVRSFDYE
jgi:hypothetical protein